MAQFKVLACLGIVLGLNILTLVHFANGQHIFQMAPDDTVNSEQNYAYITETQSETADNNGVPEKEVKEPPVTAKKAVCSGCDTEIHLTPINADVVNELAEQIVKAMDTAITGPYIHANPQVMKVQKRVESGVKYTVTFLSRLSWCRKDEMVNRNDCPPQEDGVVCVAEVFKRIGQADGISNNCTDFGDCEFSPSNENEIPVNFNNVPEAQVTHLKESEIPVDDEREPRKASNVGALKDVDESETELIKQFAKLAAQTWDEIDPDNAKTIVLKIVDAKKQIVNGVMYHLVLHVGTSNCEEGEFSPSSPNSCLDEFSPKKVCRVQIHRSWAGNSPLNAKVVSSECHEMEPENSPDEFYAVESDHQFRRFSREAVFVFGGLTPKDVNDPYVKELADFALTEIDKNSSSLYQQKIARVIEAHSQVVSGTLMHIKMELFETDCLKTESGSGKQCQAKETGKNCTMKVLDQSWLKNRQVHDINCQSSAARLKRSLPVVGGLTEADVNDPYVKELAEFAFAEITKGSNQPKKLRIVKAHKQVVSGTLLHCVLELISENEEKSICTVKVWDQPWLKHREVQDVQCELSQTRQKRGVPGGLTEADLNEPYVKELADFALAEIATGSNEQKKIRITKAHKQVVSGVLMHFEMELSSENGEKTICTVKVWDRPWLKLREIQDNQCELSQTRQKRGVPGGLTEADLNEPYVKELADFALAKIATGSNEQKKIRITKAHKQVVSGTLMHFEMELSSESGEKTICTVKVWDRPWLKLREIQDNQCELSQTRQKRGVPGGLTEADLNEPYVKELADFALAEIATGSNEQKKIRITKAHKQVVSGTLMHFEMELSSENGEKTICTVKVWDRPWLKLREIQDNQCELSQTRQKRDALSLKHYSSEIRDVINFVLEQMDMMTNSPFSQKFLALNSADREVNGGVETIQLQLKVGYSICKKSKKPKIDCPLSENLEQRICDATVLHFVSANNYRLVDRMHCSPSPRTNLKSHLVGEHDVDVVMGRFREFMRKYNKSYSSGDELISRFHIFRENLKLIKQLQDGEQGTATYGPTIFADLSPEEFKKNYLGLRRDLKQENAIPMAQAQIPDIQLPDEFDWREKNVVTPVKNQGICGSCWAFAVTGNLEGQYAIKNNVLLSFSEQELVDCDTLDDGCQGGLPENAYHALEQMGGIETEKDYPYEGRNEQCQFNRSEVAVRVKSSVNITSDEIGMAKWLVQNGPIAIGINANAMQFYYGGVSHPWKFLCQPTSLDHGVLIVGYGVHTSSIRKKVLPYWLIKNSWGTFWGEKGYYRVYRGDGTCGVNAMASSAFIE